MESLGAPCLSVQSNPQNGMLNIGVPPSLNAAMLNIDAFSSNLITKVPLVIATTTAFFAVVLHWLTSLQLHSVARFLCSIRGHLTFNQAHHVNHIKRSLVVLVTFLALSVFAILFVLPAHSWSQTECSAYCWAQRALVLTGVIGGLASLMIGGWRMRGARVD